MTREEKNREKEITQAVESEYFITKAEEFAWINGAEWADQHPRKGLWDSEKVIEWLKNNASQYMEDNHKYGEGCEYDTAELVKDLAKAMEE